MKRLILLRHAKSDWSDAVLRDFDRPLNGRGERAATLMGDWAKQQGLRCDKVIASPAARVQDTLNQFRTSFPACPEPHWDRRLYLATSDTLIDIVQETADDIGTLMLVGHNPGLEDLVLDLVPDDRSSPLREAVEEKYPTAAIAILGFEIDHWSDLAPGARLLHFVRPRDLDPALGPEGR
jgi:phosphohistidine phosphatase